ncbi:MAG: hypothetical protein K8R21_08500 [Leptospira sp.]|nr:hypothetical protein [Leptospira sp.]
MNHSIPLSDRISTISIKIYIRSFCLILFLFISNLQAEEKSKFIDFVYIDANSGQSSGGHTGLKFGNLIYHFQYYFDDQIFRMVRESWEEFRFVYGVIDNRNMVISRISVSDTTYTMLQDRMNQLYLVQNKQLGIRGSLVNDKTLLEIFLAKDSGIKLKAAGYFSAQRKNDPYLMGINRKINENFGKGYLEKKRDSVNVQIRNFPLELKAIDEKTLAISRTGYPFQEQTFSEKYLNLIYEREALSAIIKNKSLKPLSYFYVQPDENQEFELDRDKRTKLENFATELESQITGLASFRRNDYGYPLLVALARYLSIRKSLEENRLIFLDCFDERDMIVTRKAIRTTGAGEPLKKESYLYFELMLKSVFAKSEFNEFNYNLLEDSANRNEEIKKGLGGFTPIRTTYDRLIPVREEDVETPSPAISDEKLKEFLAIAAKNESTYLRKLQKLYNYNLITKNCTNEIFNTLNLFFKHGESESKFRLGGYIDGNKSFVFIPFYASFDVNRKYNVPEIKKVDSFRIAKVAEMYKKENKLSVFLRESNTISSTVYKYNPDDSFFVFFTDDTILLRPLYGIINLIAGIGETFAGIVYLPFDRGEKLLKGIQGIFFSMPELVFFNIRKGTFTLLSRQSLGEEFLQKVLEELN